LIVVSGTSPILNLSAVGHIDLLRQLLIPQAVATELRWNDVEHRSQEWLILTEPTNWKVVDLLSLRLDRGEAEAIAIALEFELQPLGSWVFWLKRNNADF
jgi:predicted nucleic acid-binding protein